MPAIQEWDGRESRLFVQCTQRRETVWTFLLPPPPLLKGKEAPFFGIPFETGEVGNKRAKSSRRGFCHRRMGNSLNGPRTLSRTLVHKFQKMAILVVRVPPLIRIVQKDPRFDHLPRGNSCSPHPSAEPEVVWYARPMHNKIVWKI